MVNNRFFQGDVWLANLNPSKKTEPGKIRPVLLIQSQFLLDAGHSTTIVIPLTTNLIDQAEPLRIRIAAESRLQHNSDLLVDQVRAIDNSRLIEGPLLNIGASRLQLVINSLQQLFTYPFYNQ
ncbi:MAG: type II toxin-antitoxin system PemK/MazF family toxin [Pseudomonadota bacterium]